MRTDVLLVLAVILGACGGGGLPRVAIRHNTAGAELLRDGDLDQAEARFHLALEYQPRFAACTQRLSWNSARWLTLLP